MVGTKPVSARFALLPDTKPRMSAMGTSVVIQIGLVALLVIVPLFFPQQMIPHVMTMVTDLSGPPLDIPEPPKPKPPAAAEGRQSGASANREARACGGGAAEVGHCKVLCSQDCGTQAEGSRRRG